jgi:hypothetical protein
VTPFPMGTGVKVWLSTGYTDMRCGFPSLALRVQEVLKHDPLSGHLFVFRGRRSDILKIIWHDGLGACRMAFRGTRRNSADCTGTIGLGHAASLSDDQVRDDSACVDHFPSAAAKPGRMARKCRSISLAASSSASLSDLIPDRALCTSSPKILSIAVYCGIFGLCHV